MKSCCICSKDPSSYKCPKCCRPYCSVACCKVHKETCENEQKVTQSEKEEVESVTTSTAITSNSQQNTVQSSQRLQLFLNSNPYLQTQLPVLLARIHRHDISLSNPSSQLARDLEKKDRVTEILKEAIDTDPKISELYLLLQEEGLI